MYRLNQSKIPLLEAMKAYAKRDVASFDVPGHKRGVGVPILADYFGSKLMELDTNSLPRLDHAGNPTSVIKEAQDLLADAYGADEAFFITNGSTAAIQTMLMSVISPGEKILLPKNSHKSALNGLILCGGIPVYMKPEICAKEGLAKNVTLTEVRHQLNLHPDAKAVFLINPTYFGYVTELGAIAELCHKRQVLLLVDEAHGAHFPFHPEMPPSAMACGADMSAISVHKTGGALTQASALVVKGRRVALERVKQVVNILQSTSASYLLMGSLDGARYNLVKNGEAQLSKVLTLGMKARKELNLIPGISTVEEERGYDFTKLVMNVSGLSLTGFQVYELLWRDYDIQLELCETHHLLAILSLGDSKQSVEKLIAAMKEIAMKYVRVGSEIVSEIELLSQEIRVIMSPREAYFSEKQLVPFDKAIGKISGESIMAYPPGIPIISPGELITKEVIASLVSLKEKNACMVDNTDAEFKQILIVNPPERSSGNV